MQNEPYLPHALTQEAARLTAERDALRGQVYRLSGIVRDLDARPAPRQRDDRGFARRVEKRVLRPILYSLRGALTGRRSEQQRQPKHQTERLSSVPPPQYDALSEMRRLATVMENTLLTLAMERSADGGPAAAAAPSEPTPTTRERPQPDPSVRLDGVGGPTEDREGLGGFG